MQELMLLSFSFSQSLGSRIRRYRGDPNAGNFSGRGEHRALGRIYIELKVLTTNFGRKKSFRNENNI